MYSSEESVSQALRHVALKTGAVVNAKQLLFTVFCSSLRNDFDKQRGRVAKAVSRLSCDGTGDIPASDAKVLPARPTATSRG